MACTRLRLVDLRGIRGIPLRFVASRPKAREAERCILLYSERGRPTIWGAQQKDTNLLIWLVVTASRVGVVPMGTVSVQTLAYEDEGHT